VFPRDIICPRNISINTLHKGDDDDDDDDNNNNNNNNNSNYNTGNNWSHQNSNKRFKEKEATPGKHSIDSLQNAAKLGTSHNKESAAICNSKPERWGLPLVQEKYQGEKACDRRQRNNNNNNKCNFLWA